MRNCANSFARTATCGLAALALLLAPLEVARSQDPRDRGIGGTGVMSSNPDDDRGIGGTGIMGTIRGFGSIIVNGMHVTYAPDVPVRIDGQPRAASDLRIGQVVQVVAEASNGVLRTKRIDVTSEVVGPIEAREGTTLRVLGQTVSTEKLTDAKQWRRGERVAVFGLRRPDGVIVASLIEHRPDGPDKVVGSVTRLRDGSLRIGQLRLSRGTPALAGTRIVLEGEYRDGVLDVTRTVRERDLLDPGIRRFSMEAYVERTPKGLRLGSGLEVAGKVPAALPSGSYAPAVVTAVADQRGRLDLQQVSLEGRPVRSGGATKAPDTRSVPSAPSGAKERKASPVDPNFNLSRSPHGGSPTGTARGRSGNGTSPGNAGSSRGGPTGGGGSGSSGGGNAGGNGGGRDGGNAGGNGNSGGNGGGGRR